VIAAWLGLLLSLAVLALPVFKDHDGGARWVIGAAVAIAATILVLDVAIPYRQERQQRPKTTESCQRRMPRLTKEYGSSWIFELCLTWANALRRVQRSAFSLVA
jgi:hypothetical protein